MTEAAQEISPTDAGTGSQELAGVTLGRSCKQCQIVTARLTVADLERTLRWLY